MWRIFTMRFRLLPPMSTIRYARLTSLRSRATSDGSPHACSGLHRLVVWKTACVLSHLRASQSIAFREIDAALYFHSVM